jgi:hypothetical protein
MSYLKRLSCGIEDSKITYGRLVRPTQLYVVVIHQSQFGNDFRNQLAVADDSQHSTLRNHDGHRLGHLRDRSSGQVTTGHAVGRRHV